MNNDFLKKLIITFNTESKDRLQKISDILLALENDKNPNAVADLVEIVFREVHSLKSSARAINYKKVEEICQTVEDVLASWKQNHTIPSASQLDILHKANDLIIKLTTDKEGEKNNTLDEHISGLIKDLKNINSVSLEVSEKKVKPPPIADKNNHKSDPVSDPLDTIRISSSKIDTLFVQTEEMLSTKLNLMRNIGLLSEVNSIFNLSRKERDKFNQNKYYFKKIAKENNRQHVESTSSQIWDFIDKNEILLTELTDKINTISKNLDQSFHTLSTQLDALLDNAKKILMLPFTTLLKTFPKVVRDLSRSLGKEVNFTIEGGEIEIDKRILEEMKDVLLHIIRNAIDHGIEESHVRQNLHKSIAGNLMLKIQQVSGNEILLTISDDGSGIDLNAVKNSALKQGIISSKDAEVMSDNQALDLIFHSGVSSSAILTDLSGRGLGMAIIKEKIEKISGNISIKSETNKGTEIKISLPLMIATFKGTLIKIAEQLFIIPTTHLERTIRLRPENISKVENSETILYNGNTTSLVWLADVLSIPHNNLNGNDFLSVIIITSGDKKIAFVVDDILHEQEISVKNFKKPLSRIRNIAAASILENGKPVPIINTTDLMNSIQTSFFNKIVSVEENDTKMLKHILLVEDSITTRMVLKNIFELSGFQVTACADGLEAWTTVKSQDFSAVVSDVDMPRMNGFELTEKIRNDNTISHLPVILVTARESNQDKAKGIDVGANAYITKSDFEGNALVEVVQKFMV